MDSTTPVILSVVPGCECHSCRLLPAIHQALDRPRVSPLLLRASEAAEVLACSRSTIYELIQRGELSTVQIGTEKRIRVSSIRSWVEQGGSLSSEKASR